jgi:hypothetical protein
MASCVAGRKTLKIGSRSSILSKLSTEPQALCKRTGTRSYNGNGSDNHNAINLFHFYRPLNYLLYTHLFLAFTTLLRAPLTSWIVITTTHSSTASTFPTTHPFHLLPNQYLAKLESFAVIVTIDLQINQIVKIKEPGKWKGYRRGFSNIINTANHSLTVFFTGTFLC